MVYMGDGVENSLWWHTIKQMGDGNYEVQLNLMN
jgi:hypothetical protein